MPSLGRAALCSVLCLALSAGCGDATDSGVLGGGDPAGDGGGHETVSGEAGRPGLAPTDPGQRDHTCGEAGAKKGFQARQSLTVNGEKRTYELSVPQGYDGHELYPLIFVFHGDGGTGAGIRSSFRLESASREGAIFVYPDGTGRTWRFDNAAGLAREVALVDQLATQLGRSHCTDPARTFAVGFSRGGYLANMLGCFATTRFGAVVAHGGGGPFGVPSAGSSYNNGQLVCPRPPVAAMQVIGQNDGLLGEGRKARDHWRRVNACQAATSPYAPSPCVSYNGCAADRPEIYCEIPGLGHALWDKAADATWSFLAAR